MLVAVDVAIWEKMYIDTHTYICISYVTSARYVAGINLVIYSGNVPNGRDITNLCRHEPAVMAKGGKFSRKTGL